jgi:stage V sporulation protein G
MKNHLRAQYCNQCGKRMSDARAPKDADGRAKLYADIAHPINSDCREMIQEVVINEFYEEIERAKQPGYVSRYDDFDLEYSDAPRSKPPRFDQPHSHQPDRPHSPAKTAASAGGAPKAHFRCEPAADGHSTAHSPPPAGGSFGAGIFPE